MFGFFKNRTRQKQEVQEQPNNNSVIYMANHISKYDLTHLHQQLPIDVHFIVFDKEEMELNRKTITGRKVTWFDELTSVHIKKLISMLETGEPILLFGEKRISRMQRVMRIYEEFAVVAHAARAKIYPVIIEDGGQKTAPLQQIASLLDKPQIHVGEPFSIHGETKEAGAWMMYRHLTTLYVKTKLKSKVNLFNELIENVKRFDQQAITLKDPTAELSYRKLLISIQVLSGKLGEVLHEPRVGVLLPSAVGHVVTLFSLFKLGVTPAILNFTMGHKTLKDCCETAEIRTIITSKQFIEKAQLHDLILFLSEAGYTFLYLEEIRSTIGTKDKLVGLKNYASAAKGTITENEIILFTSGSENKPKGVVLTHDQIYANIQQAMSVMDLGTHDRLLNPLPMFHSFGLTVGTFLPLLSGIPLVIYPSPIQYKVIPELIYQEDITLLLSTPTFLNGYGKNAHPYDLHTVRYAIAGAEAVKEETKELFYQKFGIRILEGYGATEAAPLIALNTPIYTKAGSVGKVVPTLEYKIEKVEGIEEGGTLLVKGPNVMKGYLIHDKGFVDQNDWYNTGDVVEIDQEGYITIKSRLKRFAKIGGEMISLNLVESIAMKCFDDIGFSAVSIPDKRKGEQIILYTTQKDVSLRELKKFVKANHYSAMLLPQEIKEISEIPLLGSGKTDYVTLQLIAKKESEM